MTLTSFAVMQRYFRNWRTNRHCTDVVMCSLTLAEHAARVNRPARSDRSCASREISHGLFLQDSRNTIFKRLF